MAEKIFAVDINLQQNQLKNAVLHSTNSAPTSPTPGQIYFNNTDKNTYVWDSISWVDLTEVYTHPTFSGTAFPTTALTGANIITQLNVNNGHVTGVQTRAITYGDLGITDGTLSTLNTGTSTTNSIWSAKTLTDWIAAKSYLTSVNLTLGTTTSTSQPITNSGGTGITLPAATTSLAGLMTAADKTKLDGIATGGNNYILPTASTTVLGGIKLASDTKQTVSANAVTAAASRTYGVQLNASDQAVVNIPWTDTVYTHPSFAGSAYPTTATTGLSIISQISVNNGHVTGTTLRTLTSNDIASVMIVPGTNTTSTTQTWSAATINSIIQSQVNSSIVGALVFKGSYNASTNSPNLSTDSTIKTGYTYVVSVAGTFNGEAVEPGDMIIAKADNPGSTLSNYTIVNKNIPTIVNASETASGIVELATTAETLAGTDNTRAITPAGLSGALAGLTKYTGSFGTSGTISYTITHNLNTLDVDVTIYRASDRRVIEMEWYPSAVNTVSINMNIAPSSSNEFLISIQK